MPLSQPLSIWNAFQGAEIRFVQGKKYRSRIAEAGKGKPETLILTHGGGGHLETFAYNVVPLGEHFHTIGLEILWHGWSDAPRHTDNPPAQIAEQVIDLMDMLGVQRAWVHGEAMSASAIAWLARKHADRLKGVIFESGVGMKFKEGSVKPPLPPVGGIPMVERSRQLLKNPTWEGVRERLLMVMHYNHPERVTNELVDVRFLHYTRPHTRDAQTRMYESLASGDAAKHYATEEEMARLRMRVLVLWCDGSGGPGPDAGQRLASIIPGARFKLLPETGFWAHWENPSVFNEAIRQFIMGEQVR
ncbi:MAG: alpha/beta fold hydrolase [SAR202 cluster bacterium]|nr:alpha/beta fold hydrolase [SAR202 cluster bacterium]